jgi:hypothetical protein
MGPSSSGRTVALSLSLPNVGASGAGGEAITLTDCEVNGYGQISTVQPCPLPGIACRGLAPDNAPRPEIQSAGHLCASW